MKLYPRLPFWLAGLSNDGLPIRNADPIKRSRIRPSEGVHRARLLANDSTESLNFDWQLSGQDTQMVIFNADERIVLQEIEEKQTA